MVVVVDVVLLVLVVVVFATVVVCVFVVTGATRVVVVLVVVVTGATRVTADVVVVVVTAGAAAASVLVVVELVATGGFLRWCFLWCTARLEGAAAAFDVVLDVVEEDELVDVVEPGTVELVEALWPPALPQPTMTRPAMPASSAAFIRPTPLFAPSLGVKANNA